MTGRTSAAWAVVVAVALGGCGVPIEQQPRAIDAPPGALPDVGSGAPVQPGTAAERLCLVRNNVLAAVTRAVPNQISVDQHLRLLVQGPTDTERAAGYTSALTGTTTVQSVTQARGIVTVDLAEQPEGTGRSDEILAYGQVVCTLTTRPSVAAVVFTNDRRPLAVPRADGSLSSRPLTAADYAPLLSAD
jgi:spore germination protein GerM